MNSVPNIKLEQKKMCTDFDPNKILNFDRHPKLSRINDMSYTYDCHVICILFIKKKKLIIYF